MLWMGNRMCCTFFVKRTSVTDFRVRQAGFGAKYGYDTIPTHAQIFAALAIPASG